MDEQLRQKLIRFQRNEITEYHVYKRLAKLERNPKNQAVLQQIAEDELRHYRIWLGYTEEPIKPDKWKIFKHYWIAKLFGVTFGIKLMERAESGAQHDYSQVVASFAEAQQIADEEEVHENALIGQIDEDLLKYTGSVVLGINDALVELTGALAGLTLALGDAKLIALTGSVTGIAAAFSMAASEYLSTKTEAGEGKQPVRAAVYTGIAYLVTVVALIAPYLIIPSLWGALGATMAVALGIIFLFNYYIAVAQDQPFRKRFTEMAVLSLSVAALSFGVGFVMRRVFNIEV
jgi:VIT1/CCC1 family predicted Fe2+/Mn2+ transporter